MLEVSHACEYHGHIVLVRSRNHFLVSHRPTGLNYSRYTNACGFIDAIPEREKSIRREHGSSKWKMRFHRSYLN